MKNMNRTECVMFRMTPELKKRLDVIAKLQGISLNEWLNRTIEPISINEIVKGIRPYSKKALSAFAPDWYGEPGV